MIPESGAPYKRGWDHTKSRGSESTVRCTGCGAKVPRYKTIVRRGGMKIKDPAILKAMDGGKENIHMFSRKQYFCPACARHRKITKKKNR